MTTFPNSPQVLKGGIVLIDPEIGARCSASSSLQYNPDTLTRTLQVQAAGGEGGDRSEALRLKGPPVETIKLDAEIDATDQLEFPDQNRAAVELGIQPQLAALETLVYPTERAAASRTTAWRSRRHARDRADGGAADAVRLEQEPHRAGAAHRLQHHRGGVRPGAQPDPRQGQPRDARAERRRPRLRAQGRQPLHGLPADARSSSRRRRQPGRFADARHRRHRHDRSRSGVPRRPTRSQTPLFPPTSRYHGIAAAQLHARRTARRSSTCGAASCRRRSASRCCASTRSSQGDRLDNLAAQLSRRPGAVLAHLRRQRRAAPRRADRDRRPARCASRCPKAFPGAPDALRASTSRC